MKRKLLVVLAILAVLCWVEVSFATPISFEVFGRDGTGSTASGTFDFVASSATLGDITISLTNNTPASVGNYVTAVVFNNPSTPGTFTVGQAGTGSTFPANFSFVGVTDNGIMGSNNGYDGFRAFDIGAAIDPTNALAGGSPADGIIYGGGTGTFTFHLIGTNLNLLTAADIFNTLSTVPDQKPEANFLVRFRGGPTSDYGVVPIPPSALLLGSGLLGLVGLGWRRRKS